MSTRDHAADAALLEEHGFWISGASRKAIKERFGIGSTRATRLRRLAWERVGRMPVPVSASRIADAQDGHEPARNGHFDRPHILVVGDAHYEPDNSVDRARWLGQFIRDNLGPDDHVVIIGDWHGLTSLCSHSSPKEKQGHRLAADIEAGNAAIRAMFAEMADDCSPTVWVTLGNHEHRLARLAEDRPEYDGIAGFDLLEWETYGARVLPYLEPLRLHGWRFQHCLMNKGGRRAISGVNIARSLLARLNYAESIVVGHSHVLQTYQTASVQGGRRWGISAGCYFDHAEHYAGEDSNAEWWAGLVLLEHAHNGDAGVRCIPFDHLRAMYSDSEAA